MLPLRIPKGQQIPLIHQVHADDEILANSTDGEWFNILQAFPWDEHRQVAADYYNALYEFNLEQQEASKKIAQDSPSDAPSETKEDAQQRLLFERTTLQMGQEPEPQILFEAETTEPTTLNTRPDEIAPGVVPNRALGRRPKCFFGLLKSFIGTPLLGLPAEPENVRLLLATNPSFARACGFVPKAKNEVDQYHSADVPSRRKLEQFDQVMRQAGLWDKLKVNAVKNNIEQGVIQPEKEWVGDTTHYFAYSSFETVPFEDANGKACKKSQSKPTKACRCEDRENCDHGWVLADDGAGTVVKSKTKMYWAHKAAILGLPGQGIALDAIAVRDAATHDGQTFLPHVRAVYEQYPELSDPLERVLYDSACNDASLKTQFEETLGLELKASFNPRRAPAVTQDLPRGIEKITPYGVPICRMGYEMDFQCIRYKQEKFIFQAPKQEDGRSVCGDCIDQNQCCNSGTKTGRTISVSFDTLPQIDPNDPPMAKRFKAIMKRRPSVERMIKRLKCDLGDDRLSKRGNESFQAYLDKTMIAYHWLLGHTHQK